MTSDPSERDSPRGEPIRVEVATAADRSDWDAFVASHPGATGYHSWSWREVFARSFGHESIYLVVRRNSRIAGVLPLVFIKSRIFGRTLTSLPFLNYGGVVADADDVARALIEESARIGRASRCRHVELRHLARRFSDLPCKQHKVTMHLRLSQDLWNGFDRKVRNQVRKAEKSHLTVERGGSELLDEFYTVFARNMRDLGTPVHARRFFEQIIGTFPDRARIVVVRLERKPVAAALTLQTGQTVEVPWASSVREHNSLCPNHLLYWHAIETAANQGCAIFDFGRSTPNEGTYKFKEQWGATPVALHWEYLLLQGQRLPDQSPKNPKFRMAIDVWRRLPLSFANTMGPWIVKWIP